MKILGDFHIHSTFSDGNLSIPELVDYFGIREFGTIAITDHYNDDFTMVGKAARLVGKTLTPATLPLYFEILKSEAERAWRQYRMVLIPGIEFTKSYFSNDKSNHIIGLGLTSSIDPNLGVAALTQAIRDQGGMVIAAHPVSTGKFEKQTYYLWDNREEFRKYFDAWEISCTDVLLQPVVQSDLPKIASSDFHSKKHMDSWKTVLNCERSMGAILNAIRKQEVEFQYYADALGENKIDLAQWLSPSHLVPSPIPIGLGNLFDRKSL